MNNESKTNEIENSIQVSLDDTNKLDNTGSEAVSITDNFMIVIYRKSIRQLMLKLAIRISIIRKA